MSIIPIPSCAVVTETAVSRFALDFYWQTMNVMIIMTSKRKILLFCKTRQLEVDGSGLGMELANFMIIPFGRLMQPIGLMKSITMVVLHNLNIKVPKPKIVTRTIKRGSEDTQTQSSMLSANKFDG